MPNLFRHLFYLHNAFAKLSNSVWFSSLNEDLIVTASSKIFRFLLFSNMPVITFLAVDAQEPFSIKAIVLFW